MNRARQHKPRGYLAGRPPAVAGRFYPADPDELRAEIALCFTNRVGATSSRPKNSFPFALVVPHAGLVYSGPVAASAFATLTDEPSPVSPLDAVVIGPNHHGLGTPIAVAPDLPWQTPLGSIQPATDLIATLLTLCPTIKIDAIAHAYEHSIEVQTVFLQTTLAEFRLAALTVHTAHWDRLLALGHALAEVSRRFSALLIASTDLSHYFPDAIAREVDRRTIDAMLELDPDRLRAKLERDEVQMCGGPAVLAVMVAARELGAREATLLAYGTSGDTGGGRSAVVGYAALRIDIQPVELARPQDSPSLDR